MGLTHIGEKWHRAQSETTGRVQQLSVLAFRDSNNARPQSNTDRPISIPKEKIKNEVWISSGLVIKIPLRFQLYKTIYILRKSPVRKAGLSKYGNVMAVDTKPLKKYLSFFS